MRYDPSDSERLASSLNAEATQYWHDYVRYWTRAPASQLSPEERVLADRLEAIGSAWREVVHSWAPGDALAALGKIAADPEAIGIDEQSKYLRFLFGMPIVRDSVEIQLALEVTDVMLPQAQKRLAVLVELLGVRKLPEAAVSYLDRVTRLYLWGLEPECIIMCRSSLEAALATRLEGKFPRDKPVPTLDTLLKLAGQHRVLEGFQLAKGTKRGWRCKRGSWLWRADQIRISANRLIHSFPVLEARTSHDIADGRTAIAELSNVLDELFA